MKVLQINIFGNLSTGNIAADIYRTLAAQGDEGLVAFARGEIAADVPHYRIGTDLDVKIHGLMTRLTDRTGFFSGRATEKLIEKIEAYRPDVVHLHNLHGYYLHVGKLFQYLKKSGIPVVWTLHDCWAFTGHCCYYSMAGCEKWKTGCGHCPQKKAYPASLWADASARNYREKKKLFSGVNMQLVAVSEWLLSQVGQSFLSDYPARVIYNGVDMNVFRPTMSDFRKKYGLEGKTVVLGVASTWDVRKGLNDFIALAGMLDDSCRIVLVGVGEQERKKLPPQILAFGRTDGAARLAEIYGAADLFFNASVEETFGLPTVEALACGTPAVVYRATALPETVTPSCGFVAEPHDLAAVREIIMQKKFRDISRDDCLRGAARFEKTTQYRKYTELYREICPKGPNVSHGGTNR